MKYPSRSEYAVSIRNPEFAFRKVDLATKRQIDLDSALIAGQVVQRTQPNGMKDVWSASGGYAIAFKYETDNAARTWAVRCFFRANYNVERHYTNALDRLKRCACPHYFVDFSYLNEGIRVFGDCYPILKMEWIEGPNLKQYLKQNLQNREVLLQLAQTWRKLCLDLLHAGIAHGDLQHGNILFQNGRHQSLKLIDYDSLYFRVDSSTIADGIKGLPGYQPPARKALQHRCLEIDFFPQLVIYLSILALAEEPTLWETYNLDNTDSLLFSNQDFLKYETAPVFQSLATLPEPISLLSERLKQFCRVDDLKAITSLEEVLTGQRPGVSASAPPVTPSNSNSDPQLRSPSGMTETTLTALTDRSVLTGAFAAGSVLEDSSPELYREWAEEYYVKKAKGISQLAN